MPKPDLNKVPPHLHAEIDLVEADDIKKAFSKYGDTSSMLQNIPGTKWDHRYAEGKWTIKEVIQHVIDAERIFPHRSIWPRE